jgi:hypothetical protein
MSQVTHVQEHGTHRDKRNDNQQQPQTSRLHTFFLQATDPNATDSFKRQQTTAQDHRSNTNQ